MRWHVHQTISNFMAYWSENHRPPEVYLSEILGFRTQPIGAQCWPHGSMQAQILSRAQLSYSLPEWTAQQVRTVYLPNIVFPKSLKSVNSGSDFNLPLSTLKETKRNFIFAS